MQFINFLYANLKLEPPKGQEDRVNTIMAHKSHEYITACVQFSPEELAEIQKTGVVWISMLSQTWPPVKVEAYIPQHCPFQLTLFNEETLKRTTLLQYLDLTLVLLKVDAGEYDFGFREEALAGTQDGKSVDVWDLTFTTIAFGVRNRSSGKYLFGTKLEVAGHFSSLERLEPLKMIYPFLCENDWLVLHPPFKPVPKIISLYE